MRRLLVVIVILFAACQNQAASTGGLVVVTDTANIGPPPECLDDEDTTGGEGTASDTGETRGPVEEDPGTVFCGQFKSSAACDHTPRLDGDRIIGECHWVQVVPVLPGTCEGTQLYETCIHTPVTGAPCVTAQSCGQPGLGVYGRTGCDGTIEVIVNPPGLAYCAAPTDWPLCWPDDARPECTCICS